MDDRTPDEFDTPRGARLTALMERAVADRRVAVAPPAPDAQPPDRRTPRRWAVTALSAAAAIALITLGVITVARDDGTDTLQTADPAPAPADRSSMWRIPTDLPEGMTLDSASVNAALDVLVAVDDLEAPERVLMISFVGYGLDTPVVAEEAVGAAHIFSRRAPALDADPQGPEEGALFQTAITGPTRSYAAASVMSAGVDEAEVRRVTTELAAALPPGLLDPSAADAAGTVVDSRAALAAAVESVRLPEGMVRAGSWEPSGQRAGSFTVGVTGATSGGCAVTLTPARPEAQRRVIEGLIRRTTMGSVYGVGTPVGPEGDAIHGEASWIEAGGISATPSPLLQVFDGGAQIGVNCFTTDGEVAPDAWVIQLAERLEPVDDEPGFRAAMAARGVTVTGD